MAASRRLPILVGVLLAGAAIVLVAGAIGRRPAPESALPVIQTPQPEPAGVSCILGVGPHHVSVDVVGPDAGGCAVIEALVPHPYSDDWTVPGAVYPGSVVNCEGVTQDGRYTVIVRDDPSGSYATSICQALGL